MKPAASILSVVLCWLLIAAAHGQGASGVSGTFLRVANLMPVTSKPLTISQGADLVIGGVRPGFFMSYTLLPKAGGKRFTVSSEGLPVGDFTLAGSGSFFTVVALMREGKPAFVCLADDEPPPPPRPDEPPPPPSRFRGYFGGFDFPYKVEAGKLGTWSVKGSGQVIDLPFDGPMPATVTVEYVSRDGDTVRMHYPLQFADSEKSSAFVSQRGPKRPRVKAAPDNVLPAEESVGDE